MQPDEVRELYEYLIETRARFVKKFREIGWAEFAKDRGATWGSMLGILLHMLDDEEHWLRVATEGGSLSATPDRKIEDYAGFEQVEEDTARVAALTRSRLSAIASTDLAAPVTFTGKGEETFRFDTIVFHAWTDEVAHVGELVCLLWQMDVRPPFIDWIDFRAPAPGA